MRPRPRRLASLQAVAVLASSMSALPMAGCGDSTVGPGTGADGGQVSDGPGAPGPDGADTPAGADAATGADAAAPSLLDNQYVGARWCKTTVHTHPAKTSGETLAGWYQALGFDFAWFTDHDYDDWTVPPAGSGLTIGRGEEVSAEGHCNALGLTEHIAADTYQEAIDLAAAQGGIVQINHPSRDGVTSGAVQALQGLWGIEIRNEREYTPEDVVLWDGQISQGKRLWGTFSDDAHEEGHVGRGWLMVLNGLWPRRTLGWRTAEEVWQVRSPIEEDRVALGHEPIGLPSMRPSARMRAARSATAAPA